MKPSKLEEAEKLLETWPILFEGLEMSTGTAFIVGQIIKKILVAADLISKEEQKHADAEIVSSLQDHWNKYGYPVKKDKAIYEDIIEVLIDKLLNSPDAK